MDYSDKNKRNQKRSRLAAGISLVIAFCTVLGGAALAVSQGISEYPAGSGNPAVSAQDMLSDQLGIGSMIRTLDPDQQEGVTLVSREGPSRILGIDDVDTGEDAGAETDGEQAADGSAAQASETSADASGAAEASAEGSTVDQAAEPKAEETESDPAADRQIEKGENSDTKDTGSEDGEKTPDAAAAETGAEAVNGTASLIA